MGFNDDFRERTKEFVLRVIRLFRALPKTDEARIIGKQLIRSASSIAANFRAAARARSKAEFYSKLSICVEEADETAFWIEILIESEIFLKRNCSHYIMKQLKLQKYYRSLESPAN